MDLGLFRRRRGMFWLWVLLPVALGGLVHGGVFLYCRHMAEQLQTQEALASVLPDMEASLTTADDMINRFPGIRSTAAEVRSTLTTRISELALDHGFVANNVRIKSLPPDGPLHKLEIAVEGEGRLPAIMKFVNDLQTPETLIALRRAHVRITDFIPVPVYRCELGIDVAFVPALRDNEEDRQP